MSCVLCTVRLLREELQLLQEPGSYVGEVVKVRLRLAHTIPWLAPFSVLLCAPPMPRYKKLKVHSVLGVLRTPHEGVGVPPLQVMGKNKVLVKVHPEGKYVVDLDKSIEMSQAWPTSLRLPADQLAVHAQQAACSRVHAENVLRSGAKHPALLLLSGSIYRVFLCHGMCAGDNGGARGAAQRQLRAAPAAAHARGPARQARTPGRPSAHQRSIFGAPS